MSKNIKILWNIVKENFAFMILLCTVNWCIYYTCIHKYWFTELWLQNQEHRTLGVLESIFKGNFEYLGLSPYILTTFGTWLLCKVRVPLIHTCIILVIAEVNAGVGRASSNSFHYYQYQVVKNKFPLCARSHVKYQTWIISFNAHTRL